MNGKIRSLCIMFMLILAAGLLFPAQVAAQDEPPQDSGDAANPEYRQWLPGFHVNGVEGSVYAVALDPGGSGLYIGGNFQIADGVPGMNNIAHWNGRDWEPLGQGTSSTVRALVFDGLGNLYAAGSFSNAGGKSAPRLARYNLAERSWSAPSNALLTGVIYSLAYDSVSRKLYVGGDFRRITSGTTEYLLRLDAVSGAWSQVGGAYPDGTVYALAFDSSNSILYAGGNFENIGAGAFMHIARCDAVGWKTMGSGANDIVRALALGAGPHHIYAGGDFDTAGGLVDANHVAHWNLTTGWSRLGGGVDNTVTSLEFSNNSLYVGGFFREMDAGTGAKRVARWDESIDTWNNLPMGNENGVGMGDIYAMDFASGLLYVGGDFIVAGDIPAHSTAVWNGSSWDEVDPSTGMGVFGEINEFTFSPGGSIVAGGVFQRAGGEMPMSNLGMLHPGSGEWISPGGGVRTPPDGGRVLALAPTDEYLYVGGIFTEAGGVWDGLAEDYVGATPVNNVARWDGSTWSPLGSGLNDDVTDLQIDSGGTLYAGGNFSHSGATLLKFVGRWNGSAWQPLGSGTVGVNGIVNVIKFDGSGDLIIGGCFDKAGDVSASCIARYSPGSNTFSALGTGVSGCVVDIEIDSLGNIYAAGAFDDAGSTEVNNIARYSPVTTTWSALADGGGVGIPDGQVVSLAIDKGNRLYAAGYFDMAGGAYVNNLARWNGLLWEPVGDGYPALPVPLLAEEAEESAPAPAALTNIFSKITLGKEGPNDNILFVGGNFKTVGGGLPSKSLAAYAVGSDLVTLNAPANGTIYDTTASIRLQWAAFPRANRYIVEIYRGEDMQLYKTLRTGRTSYTLSKKALPPAGGPTFWRVIALRGKTTLSGWSGLWMFYTPTPAVKLIYPPNRARMVSRQPVFEWGLVPYPQMDSFILEVATDRRFANPVWGARLSAKEPRYFLPITLQANTTYYWRVRALFENGQISLPPPTTSFKTN